MLHKWIRILFSVDFVHNCLCRCATPSPNEMHWGLVFKENWSVCRHDVMVTPNVLFNTFKSPLRCSDTCVNHVMMSASEARCLLCSKDVVVQTQAYFVNSIERGWLESSKTAWRPLIKRQPPYQRLWTEAEALSWLKTDHHDTLHLVTYSRCLIACEMEQIFSVYAYQVLLASSSTA